MAVDISVLGRILLGYIFMRLVRSLYNIFYPYLIARPRDLHKLAGGAQWAIVTGSTDGIGKAYANELAGLGFHLVLISRSADKLDTVAEEIKQCIADKKPVEIRTLQFDFTDAKLADYETKIFAKIADIDVGILINNVGTSNVDDCPSRIHNMPGGLQQVAGITVVNTLPATLLSSFVLKQMVQRGHGIIVNIASAASYFEWMFYAVYSATKKYLTHLSAIMRKEYAHNGIVVQSVCPLLVDTKLSQRASGALSLFALGPADFAKRAVRTIGLVDDTTGCMSHQIQAEFLFNYVPRMLLELGMRIESQLHKRSIKMSTKKE